MVVRLTPAAREARDEQIAARDKALKKREQQI